ncbi:MAG: hypothetical protein ND895_18255 [Pyrinomonadaceae bacterium]|nr:hypothetical protein [Pyrinomonadaceae bacterium]
MRLLFSNRQIPVTIFLLCIAGCRSVPAPTHANSNLTVTQAQKTPFTLSIVPTGSTSDSRVITIASQKPHEFYVVLTNISNEPQPVWETWNSWGSRTISFEFTFGNNPLILIARGPEIFTRNFPSTFLIPPSEHKVYPIRLDKWWDVGSIPKSTEMLVSVKAVYEAPVTPEAATYHVWTGRVESRNYSVTLRQ